MVIYNIPCGPSILDYPETSGNLRKPAAEVFGRFPDSFIRKKNLKKKIILIKDSEICRKPPRPVPGGFQRFPDNPSLTDHTVVFPIFPILGTDLWVQVAGWLVVGSIVSENCINWAYKSGLGHIYVSDLSISPT